MKTNYTFRSILTAIALCLTLGLASCGDSPIAPPPPTTTGGNNGGGNNGGGNNGGGNNGGGNNGGGNNGGSTSSTGTLTVNGNGYSNARLVPAISWYYASMGLASITLTGTYQGHSFSMMLMQGTGVGRYPWNTWYGNTASFVIGQSGSYVGVRGETIISEVDVRNGVVRGSFRGTLAHNLDTSVQIEIDGSFEAAIQR